MASMEAKLEQRPIDEPLPHDHWRSPSFRGRCYLCGLPAPTGIYCSEHQWAETDERAR